MYRLNHQYVVSEGPNNSDVFSINRSGYTCDYEIKVSKQDLDRELSHINATEPARGWQRGEPKTQKHHYYRMGKGYIEEPHDYYGSMLSFNYTVPNKFCFFIPDGLYEHLATRMIGLPYGIMVFRHDADYWTIETKKQPDFLHKEKPTERTKALMFRRASNELVELRRAHYWLQPTT